MPTGSIIARMRRLSSSCRGPSSTPKTARMITSSVSDCIEGSSANGSPTGHESIARSAASRITCLVRAHPLAVEGRQHQLALAQVLGAVEQQHRALAHDRAERRVGLAGAQLLRRAAEHLLDELRVEDHHEARVEQACRTSPRRRSAAGIASMKRDGQEDEARRSASSAGGAARAAGRSRRRPRPHSLAGSPVPASVPRIRWLTLRPSRRSTSSTCRAATWRGTWALLREVLGARARLRDRGVRHSRRAGEAGRGRPRPAARRPSGGRRADPRVPGGRLRGRAGGARGAGARRWRRASGSRTDPAPRSRTPGGQRLAVYELTRPEADERLAGREDFSAAAR